MADPCVVLQQTRTVAVLGAHTGPSRPATYVPAYLADQGYAVFPVNPRFAGRRAWGTPFLASLADLPSPADLVTVFRPASAIPDHLPELLALHPLPRAVWFQLGIRNDAAASVLEDSGIAVVQDRCALADHRHFGLGRA